MNNIAILRKSRGWSQSDLAEVVGTRQPHIARIEGGDEGVTLRVLAKIADKLDYPLYMLFSDDLSAVELELLKIYRSLPPERQKGWMDMALLANDMPK